MEDVPVPEPASGEALIKVEATGINFVDVYHRTGLYPGQLPLTLGREAAGTVERVGAGVTTCRPGDRVVSETVRGGYAQYALAAAERLVPVPDEVSSRQAAAVLLQGMTAHYLVYATYRAGAGRYLPGARGGRRCGPSALPDRQPDRRPGDRHGLDR